jgi:hypothetical protein
MQGYVSWLRAIILLLIGLYAQELAAQKLKITDFVVLGAKPQTTPVSISSPTTGVILSSSSTVIGGSIGSSTIVKSTGNTSISGNIHSDGVILLSNGNTVSGKITARDVQNLGGNVLNVGSNALLSGNIDVKGNILVSGGTVKGKVTHPENTTYTGPKPVGGEFKTTPALPELPDMPAISNFPDAGTTDVTTSKELLPNVPNGKMILSGGKTITLSGPGVYVFKSIMNSGSGNNIVFDFKSQTKGNFIIYVHGDVDLGKINATIKNGGSASRIYSETHGTGTGSYDKTIAWNVANGSSGGGTSRWFGSIWAPYAGINIGSGSGSSEFSGALWSGTKVMVQSGAKIIYVPFEICDGANGFRTNCALDFYPPDNRGKVNTPLGSELTSLYENFGNVIDSAKTIFILSHDSVMIEVIAIQGQFATLRTLLQTPPYGMTNLRDNGPVTLTVTGKFPIVNLKKLDSLPTLISYCMPLFPPVTGLGITTTQGDAAMRSTFLRDGYSLNGDSVKVGVISDSYNTIPNNPAQTDINNGDLPGNGNDAFPNPIQLVKGISVRKSH